MELIYVAGERGRNILSYVDFSNICDVIKSFLKLKQKLENNILLSLSHQVQEQLNGKINIL